MTGPIRVAIFEPYVFDRVYGNLRYLITLFERLDRAAIDPELMVPRSTRFLERVEAAGGRWRLIPAPERLGIHGGGILRASLYRKALTALDILRYGRSLSRHLRENGVAVVQCHSIRAVMTIGPFARLAGRPVLWYVKGQLANPLLDRLGFLVANRILFQGETNLRRRYPMLRRVFAAKIGILRNGIDLDEIETARAVDPAATRRMLGLSESDFVVGFVGQISPAKGMDELLEAAIAMRAAEPASRFVLMGDAGADAFADFAERFRARATAALGENGVLFLGWRADVLEIVSAVDLVILPSHEEGMPKSIIEAMALEKPVVVSRVGSVPDLIEAGVDGSLVPVRDSEALLREMLRLAADPAMRARYGAAARAKAVAHYSIVENVRGLERELLRLAGRAPSLDSSASSVAERRLS